MAVLLGLTGRSATTGTPAPKFGSIGTSRQKNAGNVWMGAEKERQIIDVYQNTMFGPYEIAEMFGITHKTVYQVLKRCDIPLRNRRAS